MENNLCPKMESTLTLLSKKWVSLIVFSLFDDAKKFSDIERYIPGLSARLLTERLKELETLGIVKKTVHNSTPIKIEYSLTRKGVDLTGAFKAIGEWAEKWN